MLDGCDGSCQDGVSIASVDGRPSCELYEHGPGNLIGNLEAKKSNLQNLMNLKQNGLQEQINSRNKPKKHYFHVILP